MVSHLSPFCPTSLIMSRRNSKKRMRQFDDVFIDRGGSLYDAPAPPTTYMHRHIDVAPSKSAQTFYSTPASPSKALTKKYKPLASIQWNSQSADTLPFDFMDPNHVFDLQDITDEPSVRKRGPGVRFYFYLVMISLPYSLGFSIRIIRCSCGFPKSIPTLLS